MRPTNRLNVEPCGLQLCASALDLLLLFLNVEPCGLQSCVSAVNLLLLFPPRLRSCCHTIIHMWPAPCHLLLLLPLARFVVTRLPELVIQVAVKCTR